MTVINNNTHVKNVKQFNETHLDALQGISCALENNFNIKLLTFRRLFTNGKIIHLSNDHQWLDHSFEHSLWQSTSSLKRIQSIDIDTQYSHVWNHDPSMTDHVYQAMYEKNLWHGLTLYDKREDYVDLWAFATDRSNTMAMNFYTNHMDIIKQFILYMHDQARHILFPEGIDISIQTTNTFSCKTEDTEGSRPFLFDFNKYYYGEDQKSYLTRSQFLCVYLLSCGKSVKDIALELAISPRTVECHLNSVKQKLGESSRAGLLDKAKYLINMHR